MTWWDWQYFIVHNNLLWFHFSKINDTSPKQLSPPSKSAKSREEREIESLRRELRQYSKKLDNVVTSLKSDVLKAADKSLVSVDEQDKEKARKMTRAKEQAVRSSQVIYMLQRRIQEIQEDLDKKGRHGIKHTKKVVKSRIL